MAFDLQRNRSRTRRQCGSIRDKGGLQLEATHVSIAFAGKDRRFYKEHTQKN